jgi:hypothetical protein
MVDETSPTNAPPAEDTTAAEPEVSASDGAKRKQNEGATDSQSTEAAAEPENKPKKAKIAMPPSVASSLTDVEKYKLESPPPADNTNEEDAEKKITTPNLMLFGLHPLIKAPPLQKMLEEYGTVKAITVRSAFASRYGHITFETVEEARKCYTAINGAKLLHKAFLVQPSMASAVETPAPSSAEKKETAETETKAVTESKDSSTPAEVAA